MTDMTSAPSPQTLDARARRCRDGRALCARDGSLGHDGARILVGARHRHAEAGRALPRARSSSATGSTPSLVPGMAEAADAVAAAVRAGERIVVFGDFDLDGISAAAVAARGLRSSGRRASARSCRTASARATGSRPPRSSGSARAAARARRHRRLRHLLGRRRSPLLVAQGVDVVVTDHHEPGELRADGVPVADPKLDPALPLARTSRARASRSSSCRRSARVSASPTCGATLPTWRRSGPSPTSCPLLGENRALVADGVRADARATPRPALAALAAVGGRRRRRAHRRDASRSRSRRGSTRPGAWPTRSSRSTLLMTDDPVAAERLAARARRAQPAAPGGRGGPWPRPPRAGGATLSRGRPRAGARRRGLARGRQGHRRLAARQPRTACRRSCSRSRTGSRGAAAARVGTVDLFRALEACRGPARRGSAGTRPPSGCTLPAERLGPTSERVLLGAPRRAARRGSSCPTTRDRRRGRARARSASSSAPSSRCSSRSATATRAPLLAAAASS